MAEAEVAGVASLKHAGMLVLTSIDRAQFTAAIASANPEFEKLFGRERIEQIRGSA